MLQSDAVLHAMQGQQAVICALGPAAGAAPGSVISEGSRNITHAMAQAGVRRLVPEPGTLALLGVGLAGLRLSRRRKAA